MKFTSPTNVLWLGDAVLQYRQANNIRQPRSDEAWDVLANKVASLLRADGWKCTDEYQWAWVPRETETDDDDTE
jgi:hypothetical protein